MKLWKRIKKSEMPKGEAIIHSTWVLKMKNETNGNKRHRAKLKARGFKDKNKYDRTEKTSPVVTLSNVRALLCPAVKYKLVIEQLDVKTAFLYDKLEKRVCMSIPKGYKLIEELLDENEWVLEVDKSIYGLKESSKRWYMRFNNFMKSKGFTEYVQPCIFYWRRKGKFVIVGLYIDDILILSNCKDKIEGIKIDLSREFEMKILGKPKTFLGMNI